MASTKSQRYRQFNEPLPPSRFRVAVALRETFRSGYSRSMLRRDLMAGLVVGIVALPLSMALAIAVGVPPQHGLYTAIVAGAVIPIFGGSRLNISGPTTSFVLLAPIAHDFGPGGLMVASLMAGVILLLMGLARFGRLIQFIPHPVTTGFTAGIAVVIAVLQMKDFLGLQVSPTGDHFWERVAGLVAALPTLRWEDLLIASTTIATLLAWPKVTTRVPSPLVAVTIGALLAAVLTKILPGFEVATIGSRFSYLGADGSLVRGIPSAFPLPTVPWRFPDSQGVPWAMDLAHLRQLIGPAFAIALLSSIESLMSAVVADGMANVKQKHDPDAELVGLGLGNIVTPFFGGFLASGALARTATNVRAGGRSPISALVYALFILLAVLLLGPLLSALPMAAMAAMLVRVAWNMCDVKHLGHMLRVAPKSDLAVLITCFSLTVLIDMVVAVMTGIVLAALLFMRVMAEISSARLIDLEENPELRSLPKDVIFYEIAGPLFFGAAEKASSTLSRVPTAGRTVILHMGSVPVMDISGLVALESAIRQLQAQGRFVIVAGIQPQPARVLAKGEMQDEPGRLLLCRTLKEALEKVPASSVPQANSDPS